MVVREPILDYLLPESEFTLVAAGLTIVAGAFGFAVAYNLLVEEDTPGKNKNDDDHRGSGSGRNGEPGPRPPIPPRSTSSILGQNGDSSLITQQTTRRPRLMFTRASTFLLNGYAALLVVVLAVFVISIAKRSSHLSQVFCTSYVNYLRCISKTFLYSPNPFMILLKPKMDIELNGAWSIAFKPRNRFLVRDFELRHRCCGYNNLIDRSHPPDEPHNDDPNKIPPCWENPDFGFDVPCRAKLVKDYWLWQNEIQHLLLVQVTMLVGSFSFFDVQCSNNESRWERANLSFIFSTLTRH